MERKRRVLLMTDWFEPGFKAGGPIRSCVNISRSLKTEIDIFVFTSDRDLGTSIPYAGLITDKWNEFEPGINIFYASPSSLNWRKIKKEILKIDADVIYLNSMFSKHFSVYPLLMKYLGSISRKIILAPRGMLKKSALQFKKNKKVLFLSLFKAFNLHKKVTFHATAIDELNEVKKTFGDKVNVELVNDFPREQAQLHLLNHKERGVLKVLFLGRVHPIKNLDFTLVLLKQLKEEIRLTIAGGIEEKYYWQYCQQLIKELPDHIKVNFVGELPNIDIEELIIDHQLLILPTKGENFGHAIFESLAAGRPVLISDQTPWRNLSEHKAGWDLPLDQPQKFVEVIERAAQMNNEELNKWCIGAWYYCKNYLEQSDIKSQYLKLFS